MTQTKTETADEFAARLDATTVADLVARGSMKWTAFPGCLGAWVAEMDFGLAPVIRGELDRVLSLEMTGYEPVELRRDVKVATAAFQQESYGWQIDPAQVFVVADVLSVLGITLTHFVEPGAKVAVMTPAYMPFIDIPRAWGRERVDVPMIRADGQWLVDYDALDAAFRNGVRLLVLCNPHNPIGKVYTRAELERIAEIVERHGGRVFSDEIHAPLTFPEATHLPYASINEVAAGHTISAVSCSKAWNTAGLKCAQMVITNQDDLRRWVGFGGGAPYQGSLPGSFATVAAYRQGRPWLRNVLAYLDTNRAVVAEQVAAQLPDVPLVAPQGTYLAWLDLRSYGLPDDLAAFFRTHANAAITDGSHCGQAGRGCIRLNFATPTPILRQMLDQLAAAITRS